MLPIVLVTALAPAAWGTTYLVTTELLPPDRPLLAGVLRALPAGLALAAVARQRPVGSWWAKAVVLGVALLVLRAGAQMDGAGVLAGFAGAVSMASGVVLTKHWGRPVPLLTFTTWQLVAGGLVLLPLALAVEGPPPALSGANLLGYFWLATVGTGIAYSLWFRGIDKLPVGQVSLLGLLSPIVATAAGWLVLDQRLTTTQLAGAALVLVAMWLGQRPRAELSRSTSPLISAARRRAGARPIEEAALCPSA